MDGNKLHGCNCCGYVMSSDDSETWWDYSAIGYNIKLIRCPKCGHVQPIKYEEEIGLRVNEDPRYYF